MSDPERCGSLAWTNKRLAARGEPLMRDDAPCIDRWCKCHGHNCGPVPLLDEPGATWTCPAPKCRIVWRCYTPETFEYPDRLPDGLPPGEPFMASTLQGGNQGSNCYCSRYYPCEHELASV